ncbi:hypothetical protein [Bowmanella pacifica]|nr:hypothetical protein [Bowmanella pacifica]
MELPLSAWLNNKACTCCLDDPPVDYFEPDMNTHSLPKMLKKLFRLSADGTQISLHTKRGVMTSLLAVIMLILCLPSVLLSLVLDGNDRIFFIATALLSGAACLYLFSQSHRLVLDRVANQLFYQRAWWWKTPQADRVQKADGVEVLLTRSGNSNSLQIGILNELYVFERPDDAFLAMGFLKQHFNLVLLEQVSDWPHKHPWSDNDAQPAGEGRHSEQEQREQQHSEQGQSEKDPSEQASQAVIESALRRTGDVVPIWSRAALIKLALPVPVFALLALLFEWGVLS